jgi:hypothetical protein
MSKPIKLKSLVEGFSWERTPGKPLPTLDDVYAKHQSKINEESELEHYMFFDNLKTIQRNIDQLLKLNPTQVDQLLSQGHDWAEDHLTAACDDITEVTNFMLNQNIPINEGNLVKTALLASK